jgi:hypothetical protein
MILRLLSIECCYVSKLPEPNEMLVLPLSCADENFVGEKTEKCEFNGKKVYLKSVYVINLI